MKTLESGVNKNEKKMYGSPYTCHIKITKITLPWCISNKEGLGQKMIVNNTKEILSLSGILGDNKND